MFRTVISRNTDNSSFFFVFVPYLLLIIKKKRVNEDETPLTLSNTKL